MTNTFRSKKLLDSAKDQPCCWCGASDGSTVACHVNSVALGKGTGIKAPDYYVAYLCHDCHGRCDGRAGTLTKDEKAEMWTWAYLRTVARWFEEGIVKVC